MGDLKVLAVAFAAGWFFGAIGAIHLYETGEMEPGYGGVGDE